MGAVTLHTRRKLGGTAFADGSVSAYPGTELKRAVCPVFFGSCSTTPLHRFPAEHKIIVGNTGREGAPEFLEMIRAYLRKAIHVS